MSTALCKETESHVQSFPAGRHAYHAPTVGFLMPQAFQMRALEWEVIRSILESDERARNDLQHLSQVLEIRMAQQNKGPAAAV